MGGERQVDAQTETVCSRPFGGLVFGGWISGVVTGDVGFVFCGAGRRDVWAIGHVQ